ncbi:MAG: hypothetical protein CVU89_06215 [Firmicutes bacterium HGW-Firmicutes-14]|nr:MAG: hypothetical protein CVU89_06215 [Firmicutes bacterium HGW-Firmicutes-14]
MVPFRIWLEYKHACKTKWFYNMGMFLLGIWVGLSQEQLVIAIFVFLLCFWWLYYKKRAENIKAPSWLIYALQGLL